MWYTGHAPTCGVGGHESTDVGVLAYSHTRPKQGAQDRSEQRTAEACLSKDDLIVIAGAGGFIGGGLCRHFQEIGFTRVRAIDKKPLPEWYQRVPGV